MCAAKMSALLELTLYNGKQNDPMKMYCAGATRRIVRLVGFLAFADQCAFSMLVNVWSWPQRVSLLFLGPLGNWDDFFSRRLTLQSAGFRFQLQGTGLLTRQIELVVFPLNVFNMGLTSFAAEPPGHSCPPPLVPARVIRCACG